MKAQSLGGQRGCGLLFVLRKGEWGLGCWHCDGWLKSSGYQDRVWKEGKCYKHNVSSSPSRYLGEEGVIVPRPAAVGIPSLAPRGRCCRSLQKSSVPFSQPLFVLHSKGMSSQGASVDRMEAPRAEVPTRQALSMAHGGRGGGHHPSAHPGILLGSLGQPCLVAEASDNSLCSKSTETPRDAQMTFQKQCGTSPYSEQLGTGGLKPRARLGDLGV